MKNQMIIFYDKGNKIEEVLVEFEPIRDEVRTGEWTCDGANKPTVWKTKKITIGHIVKVKSKDNTINIKMIKDTWNREEVEQIIRTVHFRLKSNFDALNKDIKELL